MKKYNEDSFVGLNDLPRSHFIDALLKITTYQNNGLMPYAQRQYRFLGQNQFFM